MSLWRIPDGDGYVELPVVSHICDAMQEYTYGQVLTHTITHEIGHALGGPSHSSDPECLMYKYSNNWSRDWNLSLYYRSLLRIHNKIR